MYHPWRLLEMDGTSCGQESQNDLNAGILYQHENVSYELLVFSGLMVLILGVLCNQILPRASGSGTSSATNSHQADGAFHPVAVLGKTQLGLTVCILKLAAFGWRRRKAQLAVLISHRQRWVLSP